MFPHDSRLLGFRARGETEGWESSTSIDEETDLVLTCSCYCPRPLKIYCWGRSLNGRPWDPSLMGEEEKTFASVDFWGIDPSSDCSYRWGRVPGSPTSLRTLPLEMAFPYRKGRTQFRPCSLKSLLDGSQQFVKMLVAVSFLLYIRALLFLITVTKDHNSGLNQTMWWLVWLHGPLLKILPVTGCVYKTPPHLRLQEHSRGGAEKW